MQDTTLTVDARDALETAAAALAIIEARSTGAMKWDDVKETVTLEDGRTFELLHRGAGAFRLSFGQRVSGERVGTPLVVNGVTYEGYAEMTPDPAGGYRVARYENESWKLQWIVQREGSWSYDSLTPAAARKLDTVLLPALAAECIAASADAERFGIIAAADEARRRVYYAIHTATREIRTALEKLPAVPVHGPDCGCPAGELVDGDVPPCHPDYPLIVAAELERSRVLPA